MKSIDATLQRTDLTKNCKKETLRDIQLSSLTSLMELKVEFSSQRFMELLIKLSIVELLNVITCSRR